MSKPASIKTQPWYSFDKQSYSIFTDDFVHQKLLTVKVNQKPFKGVINLKNQITKKDNAYKSSGQIKLWFPVWNTRSGYLYFRSKTDQFKVHYDDGLKQIFNSTFSYYNLYASYQSQKNFSNVVLKVGANLLAKNFNIDNRLRVGVGASGQLDFSTGHKFSWARDGWSFDMYDLIGLKNYSLLRNGARVGYRTGDNQFFLRGENQTNRNFKDFAFGNLDNYYTNFTFDFVRRIDDLTKVGIQTQFTRKKIGKSSVLLQRIFNSNNLVKAKVGSDKSLAVAYQAVIKDYGKWTLGLELSDLGTTNKSRYGLQLEINL